MTIYTLSYAQTGQLGELQYEETECPPIGYNPYVNNSTDATIIIKIVLANPDFSANRFLIGQHRVRNEEHWLIVRPDKRELEVEVENYSSLTIQFPAIGEGAYKCFTIFALPGTLRIETIPQDASIIQIDNQVFNPPLVTPHRLVRVPARPYRVTVARADYDTLRATVVVTPNESLTQTLRLVSHYGSLNVGTNADSLLIDGVPIIPFTPNVPVRLRTGQHRIQLVKDRAHQRVDTMIVIEPDSVHILDRTLQRYRHRLVINSVPQGANVRLNGVSVGQTPFEGGVDVGITSTVEVHQTDYLPVYQQVQTGQGSVTEINYSLNRILAHSYLADAVITLHSIEHTGSAFRFTYSLEGAQGKKYKVGMAVEDQAGRALKGNLGALSGTLGKKISPGNGYIFTWSPSDSLPENARVVLFADKSKASWPWLVGGVVALSASTPFIFFSDPENPTGGDTILSDPPDRPAGQ